MNMPHSLSCRGKKKSCFCTFIYIMTVFFPRMLRRNEELALGSLLVLGITERVQSLWPSQVSASWELASSKQLGLDCRQGAGSLCSASPQDWEPLRMQVTSQVKG